MSYTSWNVYWHSKAYPGVLILSALCDDMVVSVWNYHVLSLPGHVRFWNRIRIRIYGVDHTYMRLIVRFRNIFDSANPSFQLSKGLIPPIALFKFEDVLFLNGTFGLSLSCIFRIMEDSIFLMACSHSYCAMVTYLSVKGSFVLVGTCVRTIIFTSDGFKSMIANSIDFASSYTF